MTGERWRVGGREVLIAVVAMCSVAAFVLVAESMHDVGFPLDDAWIHQTYARNLAEQGEWAFVPGEPSVASTAPLYTILVAIGYLLTFDFFVWTFALGAATLIAAGWFGAWLADQLFPDLLHAGLWTGLSIVTTWHLVWAAASGMETMLFTALSLLVVTLAWRERSIRFSTLSLHSAAGRGVVLGFAGAMLTLTRPEGAGLLALVVPFVLLAHPVESERGRIRLYAAWAAGVSAGWLLGIAPYVILNLSIEGTLLPNTSAAKQAEYASARDDMILIRYARLLLSLAAGSQIALVPGMLISINRLLRRARSDRSALLWLLPLAWALVDVSAYALRLPVAYQHGRYVMPVLPHLILYGVGGTLIIVRQGRRRRSLRVLSRTLALTAVLIVPGFLVIGARQYGADVRIINTEMVATAKWLDDHVPPDRLLAVHDIGAVGYHAPRPIVDLAGLVSPEVVPIIRDGDALMRLMCERNAQYLMAFPDQRPVPADDPRLGGEPVFVTGAPYAPEAGGKNMAVYELQWGPACE